MRYSTFALCLLAACTTRALDTPSSIESADGGSGPPQSTPDAASAPPAPTTCTTHQITTLATDNVGEQIAVAGGSVYYTNDEAVVAVPIHGGMPTIVDPNGGNSGVTGFGQHVFYVDSHQSYSPITDLDVSSGSVQQYTTNMSSAYGPLSANASIILGIGFVIPGIYAENQITSIDRSAGTSTLLLNITGSVDNEFLLAPVFVGSHAFAVMNTDVMYRLDLGSGASDSQTVEGSAFGSDGTTVFVDAGDHFDLFAEDFTQLSPVPHVYAEAWSILVDASLIYWTDEFASTLHITARSGTLECSVDLGAQNSSSLGTLAEDDEAVYVGMFNNGPGPVLRVEK